MIKKIILQNKVIGFAFLALQWTSNSALALPDVPAIDRDVHMSEQPGAGGTGRPEYTRPTLPTLQTTFDGRIALSHKLESGDVGFRLQKPEKFNGLFQDSANGTFILDNPTTEAPTQAKLGGGINTNPSGLGGSIGGSPNSHHGLCDPTFDHNSSIKNPSACGAGNADDCYDLWIIRSDVNTSNSARRIHGTRVEVRVQNPKTAAAEIAEVSITERRVTNTAHTMSAFFEPMTPGDGRLLVLRANASTTVPAFEGNAAMNSDVLYFVNNNPDNFEACDVRQWENGTMRPLSHAPYDATINDRYGFAMHPFRDSQNNVIPEFVPLGTYPWIDRGADNISITAVGERLYVNNSNNISTEYAYMNPECLPGVTCDANEDAQNGGDLTGRVIMGLWTRGKMVMLDNIINNIDFTLHANDGAHRLVDLYDGAASKKRIGNGPDNIEQRLPLGNGGNNRFLDSNEHRFNYFTDLMPITPADVVWTMSSGRGTAEVSFDDYLNPNSFINSNMAHTIRIRTPNGQRDIVAGTVQNAATGGNFTIANSNNPVAGTWDIPTQGALLGDTKVEPIANGGIHGKGLWLDGTGDGIEYTIPAQTVSFQSRDWYYGLYVDPRGTMSGDQALIHFPDGSEIRLNNDTQVRFFNTTGTLVQTYTSNEPINLHEWRHYGFQINYNASSNVTSTTIYLNGYRVTSFNENGLMFQMTNNGTLTVGESPNSADLRGWIDDFKVFAEDMSPELACNHAGGTLAGVADEALAPNHWDTNWANNVQAAAHTAITNILSADNKTTYSEYVCYHDYNSDLAAHLQNIPAGLANVRGDLLFPEGPLFQDLPRPDSSANAFCLSCHEVGAGAGLELTALTLNSNLNAPNDPRRQPMQPEARVYGNIPANWLGAGIPAAAFNAGTNGTLIDELILPVSGGGTGGGGTGGGGTGGGGTGGGGSTGPVDLATSGTYSGNSGNWSGSYTNAYDGNNGNTALATARGTNAAPVYLEFNFGAVHTDFTFTILEDNSNPYQVSRWKIQGWQGGAWVDLPDAWVVNNSNSEQTYPVASTYATDRVRILLQAPSGQLVGVQEVNIIGTAQ